MSTLPDNELDLDKLFLPAWAQESSAAKYAHYEGETERPDRRDDRRGPRPPRREGPPGGGRRDEGRPRRDRRGPFAPQGERGRPPGDRADRGDRPSTRRELPRERREPPPPLPEIDVSLIPDEKGVESLARQIRASGRAYPLFDIAQMILQKPERHSVVFSIKKNAEGQPIQPLFVCALDDTLWLSEDEAVAHVLRKHFDTFYQAERTATEPPKGKYTFVAQCGMSGVILGPPNYHDYQNQLRKLHSERFSRMPFDVYKSRVRIVRDEEVVKKWIDDQSWKTDYLCLNLPEPLRLGNMEAVEAHFRQTHKENIIKPVEKHSMTGSAARNLRCPALTRLVRSVWEDQRRFPLQIATVLSQQFAGHGLQFFKVNKTVTHVCIARPHYLDLAAAPVSDGVKRIVEFINATSRCTRRQLVETLAPTPVAPPVAPIPVAAEPPPATEGQPAEAAAAAAAAPATPPQPEPAQATPEQTAVIADLHWLIHQGHVIEFANGTLETAKKPLPKPPKPEPKPEAKPAAETPTGAQPAPEPAAPAVEPAAEPPAAEASAAAGVTATEPPTEVSPVTPAPDAPAPQATVAPEPSSAPVSQDQAPGGDVNPPTVPA